VRGRRLGTWMLLDAVHLAAALGVERLEAVVRPGDEARLAALRRLDFVDARAPGPAAGVVLVKRPHAAWTGFWGPGDHRGPPPRRPRAARARRPGSLRDPAPPRGEAARRLPRARLGHGERPALADGRDAAARARPPGRGPRPHRPAGRRPRAHARPPR